MPYREQATRDEYKDEEPVNAEYETQKFGLGVVVASILAGPIGVFALIDVNDHYPGHGALLMGFSTSVLLLSVFAFVCGMGMFTNPKG